MDKKTTFSFVVFLIIALAVGFVAGQWQGKSQGTTEANQKFQPLIDTVFPEPPSYIGNFAGIIKGVSGVTIALQVNDLSDYLPHLDGSPRKTQTRFATVTPTTKITSVNGKTGKATTITLQDLKIGDAITVISDQNIRNLERFDVTEVRIVK